MAVAYRPRQTTLHRPSTARPGFPTIHPHVSHITTEPPTASCGAATEGTTRCCGFGLTRADARHTLDDLADGAQQGAARNPEGHSIALPQRRGTPAPWPDPPPHQARQRHRYARGNQRTQRQRARDRDEDEGQGLRPARARAEGDMEGPPDRAAIHAAGRPPVRHRRVGEPRGDHHQRARRGGLRAEGPRDPEGLVAAGDPGRGQQVLPRPPRNAAKESAPPSR